jgi:hypothetical protein
MKVKDPDLRAQSYALRGNRTGGSVTLAEAPACAALRQMGVLGMALPRVESICLRTVSHLAIIYSGDHLEAAALCR